MQNATPIRNNFLMRGRYRLMRRKQVVEEYFDTAPVEHDWNPRYHIAPVPRMSLSSVKIRRNLSGKCRLFAGNSFHRGLKTRLLRQR